MRRESQKQKRNPQRRQWLMCQPEGSIHRQKIIKISSFSPLFKKREGKRVMLVRKRLYFVGATIITSTSNMARRGGSSSSSTAVVSAAAILLENTNRPVKHIPMTLLPSWMLAERTRVVTDPDMATKTKNDDGKSSSSSVVYWMQRDVRSVDNWALLLASHIAQTRNVPLHVVYALQPPPSQDPKEYYDLDTKDIPPPDLEHLPMTTRHASVLLGGLQLVYNDLKDKNIPLHVLMPKSHDTVGSTVCDAILGSDGLGAETIICDFSPLRHVREWVEIQATPLLEKAGVPLYQVDAHNVVPVWMASPKREYGARTIRSKINKVLATYLEEYPSTDTYQIRNKAKINQKSPEFNMAIYEECLRLDTSVPAVSWAKPGTIEGMKQYQKFLSNGMKQYHLKRNDPNEQQICSNLSMWLNHGHISFQRIALDTHKIKQKYPSDATSSFLEEGIVRRELSDNYLYYAPNDYDKLSAAYDWARETLESHATDQREYVYTVKELEYGMTHDDLWNSAQLQAVHDGKMHGFLRMYWAKKILEWTTSPTMALTVAQYLNDKYNVDGRDPNGFVGVGWSIMGIHDQGWKEREVFGKIRFMNYNGCKRKFNVPMFVQRYERIKSEVHKRISANGSDGGNGNPIAMTSKTPTNGSQKKRAKKTNSDAKTDGSGKTKKARTN